MSKSDQVEIGTLAGMLAVPSVPIVVERLALNQAEEDVGEPKEEVEALSERSDAEDSEVETYDRGLDHRKIEDVEQLEDKE
ncbi:hypothetical protein Brms1b_012497 [Colletotrichum noveboracense]|nr:hypothetical protein Brms1b_012497 [Colletotrichum noveboracense]